MTSSILDTTAVFITILAGALTWYASSANAMDPGTAATVSQSTGAASFTTMSCNQARAMIEQKGHYVMQTLDCDGIQYRFNTIRKNARFIVLINAQSAGYVAIPR